MALPKPPTALQIQKAALAKASANSPYYYGGGSAAFTPTAAAKPPKLATTYTPPPAPTFTPAEAAGIYPGFASGAELAGVGGGLRWWRPGDVVNPGDIKQPPTIQQPNWEDLINQNFMVKGAELQAPDLRTKADEALRSGFGSALYNYGWDPNVMSAAQLGMASPYLNQQAIDAAQGNQFSALSTIAREQDLAQKRSVSALAARGLLGSGAQTNQAETIVNTAGGQRQSAFAQLMDALNKGIATRADAETAIANMLREARFNAANFVAQTYVPPTTAAGGTDSGGLTQAEIDAIIAAGGTRGLPGAPTTPTAPTAPKPPVPKPPVVQTPSSNNSPYYYGGGGYKPTPPKKKK